MFQKSLIGEKEGCQRVGESSMCIGGLKGRRVLSSWVFKPPELGTPLPLSCVSTILLAPFLFCWFRIWFPIWWALNGSGWWYLRRHWGCCFLWGGLGWCFYYRCHWMEFEPMSPSGILVRIIISYFSHCWFNSLGLWYYLMQKPSSYLDLMTLSNFCFGVELLITWYTWHRAAVSSLRDKIDGISI